MFELITISNGAAVVQHVSEGHVYRFRPVQGGVWETLSTFRTERGIHAAGEPNDYLADALAFAEEASSACIRAAESFEVSPPGPEANRFLSRLWHPLFHWHAQGTAPGQ